MTHTVYKCHANDMHFIPRNATLHDFLPFPDSAFLKVTMKVSIQTSLILLLPIMFLAHFTNCSEIGDIILDLVNANDLRNPIILVNSTLYEKAAWQAQLLKYLNLHSVITCIQNKKGYGK
jgi:uncharacterized membrane protein